MKETGIKAEDVKNLPPIEEIHGLNIPPKELHVGERCRKLKFFLRFHQDPSMSSSKQ